MVRRGAEGDLEVVAEPKKCFKGSERSSWKPLRLPKMEKGWHGAPPQRSRRVQELCLKRFMISTAWRVRQSDHCRTCG